MLPPGTQAGALAGLVMAVLQGMSVLARDGANPASLQAIGEAALSARPPMLASTRQHPNARPDGAPVVNGRTPE